jgi:AraC-like DNA-binding protein
LFNDAPFIRTAVGVDWVTDTADGPLSWRDETFLCGQHSKAMPLEYTGGIKIAGLMLRPGALRALFGMDDGAMLDRIVSVEEAGISNRAVTGLYHRDLEPAEWLEAMEGWLIEHIARYDLQPPDPLAQALHLQSFADPNCELGVFADRMGVCSRTVERMAKRDFGLTPKQVMRRARVLDMAARLCGVADDEEDDILLRFFDQAHQIREFRAFLGMTPVEFTRSRSGILTLALEIRQARRLELLDRIKPDAVRPWMRRGMPREMQLLSLGPEVSAAR